MKKGSSQGEHRKISRISTVIRVNYNTTDSFFADLADNISDEGMFINAIR